MPLYNSLEYPVITVGFEFFSFTFQTINISTCNIY